MERIIDRDPRTVEQLSSTPHPLSPRDVVDEIGLLCAEQISPKEFLGDLQHWQGEEAIFFRLNGSKGAFGKEVSASGEMLTVIKEKEDIFVSTFSIRPLQGRLALSPDNRLVLTDLQILGQPKGWMGGLKALVGLEERVRPGDDKKLLNAFLHAEPIPLAA